MSEQQPPKAEKLARPGVASLDDILGVPFKVLDDGLVRVDRDRRLVQSRLRRRRILVVVHHFPQADVHRFDDCGHYILEDALEDIIPLVRDFLATTEPRHDKQ